MRSAVALLVVVCAAVSSAAAFAAASPVVRVGTGQSLTVVGSGFTPRALVRLHVSGPSLDRRTSVRATARGTLLVRFAGLEKCSVDEVTATTTTGARARVPRAWFIRECPPPPPLAPGGYPNDD